jgi:uncharacterized protein (DUF433 family)
MLADSMTEAEILEAYPDLEPDDIRQALRYVAEATLERELPILAPWRDIEVRDQRRH